MGSDGALRYVQPLGGKMIPVSVITMIETLDHPGVGDEEKTDILNALEIADRNGYGNIMAWLGTAWAVKLRDQGITEKAAIDAVSHRTPYPLPKTSKRP